MLNKFFSNIYFAILQYTSEREAKETRHALHGVKWPVSNPKELSVEFADKSAMDQARQAADVVEHIPTSSSNAPLSNSTSQPALPASINPSNSISVKPQITQQRESEAEKRLFKVRTLI